MKTRDAYCADGVISHGERLVRKGGVLFFGGHVVQHEALKEWVGQYVFVSVYDYFFVEVNVSEASDYTKQIARQVRVETRKKK